MKRVALIFVLTLLVMSMVSATLEITLDKTEFNQGELLQAEIVGEFIDTFELENIAIYEGNEVHPVPLASSDLLKLENKYLYYAVLPSKVGNYSIKIEDTEYYIGQETTDETLIQDITISATLDSYLSASRGFIVATEDFDIKVKSLNGVQDVTASFGASGESFTREIGYNQERTFKFSISEITEYTESSLEIGGLSIPVYVYPSTSPQEPPIIPESSEEKPEDPSVPDEPTVIPLEEATTKQIQDCQDLGAQLCEKGTKCAGAETPARDNLICCLGECEPTFAAWKILIGFLIVGIVIVAGWLGYMKFKKFKEKSSKEELDEKAKKFKGRMYPNLQPEVEVKKKLSRE
jgi:hypothetical protein